mmetsp:Transcript_42777/g.83687  ORF Transcript_42777/g.83687 Transcript_42777/m.83687 type:complete len:224 (-) Transcript_42777:97-768(-)
MLCIRAAVLPEIRLSLVVETVDKILLDRNHRVLHLLIVRHLLLLVIKTPFLLGLDRAQIPQLRHSILHQNLTSEQPALFLKTNHAPRHNKRLFQVNLSRIQHPPDFAGGILFDVALFGPLAFQCPDADHSIRKCGRGGGLSLFIFLLLFLILDPLLQFIKSRSNFVTCGAKQHDRVLAHFLCLSVLHKSGCLSQGLFELVFLYMKGQGKLGVLELGRSARRPT